MRRQIDRRLVIAIVMVMGGGVLALLDLGPHGEWLRPVGTAIVGAGFAIMVTAITSTQAIREQYTKDANLRRKDLYADLHADVKKVRETLEKAQTGDVPFPTRINAAPEQVSPYGTLATPRSTDTPSLALWHEYTTDYRRNFVFTADNQRFFDALLDKASTYTAAMDEARASVEGLIVPYIEEAIQHALADPMFQHEKQARGGTLRGPWGALASDTIEPWLAKLDHDRGPTPNLAEQLAYAWVSNWSGQQPPTLGWLLARNPRKAASTLHAAYARANQQDSPPLAWFEGFIMAAWPEVQQHPACQKVWDAEYALFDAVREAESRLDGVLHFIQERFEGGSPPL